MREDDRGIWRILLRIDVIIVVIDHDSGKMRRMMRKKNQRKDQKKNEKKEDRDFLVETEKKLKQTLTKTSYHSTNTMLQSLMVFQHFVQA